MSDPAKSSTVDTVLAALSGLAETAASSATGTAKLIATGLAAAIETVRDLKGDILEADRAKVLAALQAMHDAAVARVAAEESGALSDLAAAETAIDVIDANNHAAKVLP